MKMKKSNMKIMARENINNEVMNNGEMKKKERKKGVKKNISEENINNRSEVISKDGRDNNL